MNPGDLLTLRQLQELIPVGYSTLHRLVTEGAIRGFQVRSTGSRRGTWLVPREEVDRYVRRELGRQDGGKEKANRQADDVVVWPPRR